MAHWQRSEYSYTVTPIEFRVEFYNPGLEEVSAPKQIIDEFREKKGKAKIVFRKSDKKYLSLDGFLSAMPKVYSMSHEDNIPDKKKSEMLNKGKSTHDFIYNLTFENRELSMETDKGMLDLKKLTILVRFDLEIVKH